jgi:hypothetical protein
MFIAGDAHFVTPAPKASAAAIPAPAKPAAKVEDKKKKKKAAKKNLGVAVPTGPLLAPLDPTAYNPNTSGGNFGAPAASSPPAPNTPANSAPTFNARQNLSLQDWEKTLLNQPDPIATKNFISQFKDGNVSSQIFYAIAKLMLADSRPEMQLLGVEVASAVQSYPAFNLLVGALSASNVSTQVAQAIQTQLATYANLAALNVLETALRTPGSPAADIQAAGLLTTLATQLSQALHTQGVGGGSGGTKGQNYSVQFSPVVALLNALINSPGNQGNNLLVTKASQALQAINSLLNA